MSPGLGAGPRERVTSTTLARLHGRVAARRRAFAHELSTRLVKTHDRLVVEDLAVAGLVRNRRLARAIADAGWAAFAQMLAYKADRHGGRLLWAPRGFASTRRCSGCGTLGEPLPLGQRVFVCAACGVRADRDLNAARNLAQWGRAHAQEHEGEGERQVAVKRTETVNARGGAGAGRRSRGGETSPREAGTAGDTPTDRPTATRTTSSARPRPGRSGRTVRCSRRTMDSAASARRTTSSRRPRA